MTQAVVQLTPSSSLEPRVGVVLVHYNCLRDTLRCLKTLERLSYDNFFVVVVDGASSDGSGRLLQRVLGGRRLTLIRSPENGGYAAANNFGMHYATNHGAEFVWLLNPDTSVHPEALSELVAACADEPRVAAVGSKVYYAPPEDAVNAQRDRTIWGAGATIDFERKELSMRGSGEHDRGQFDSVFDADYLPGCSLLFRTALLEEVGYLPEEYFMYFEETDWCTRIRRCGYSLRYVPQSVVWHHFAQQKVNEAFGVYYYNRNRRLFWFRYGSVRQKFEVLTETLLRKLPEARRAYRAAPDDAHRRVFRAHFRSCADFLLGRAGRRDGLSR